MRRFKTALLGLTLAAPLANTPAQQPKYPPMSEYTMPQVDEIALAKSAAPHEIADRATIEVLTTAGYQAVHQGDNGFVCMVMRGFTSALHSHQPS
jgi:hypothetical protein